MFKFAVLGLLIGFGVAIVTSVPLTAHTPPYEAQALDYQAACLSGGLECEGLKFLN